MILPKKKLRLVCTPCKKCEGEGCGQCAFTGSRIVQMRSAEQLVFGVAKQKCVAQAQELAAAH